MHQVLSHFDFGYLLRLTHFKNMDGRMFPLMHLVSTTIPERALPLGITNTGSVNEYRTARVAEVLSDFQNIQYYIAAAPVDPLNMDDYYTEGWAALRQCNLDGQHILNCGADTSVPQARGGPEEQAKAELQQFVITPWTTLRQLLDGN